VGGDADADLLAALDARVDLELPGHRVPLNWSIMPMIANSTGTDHHAQALSDSTSTRFVHLSTRNQIRHRAVGCGTRIMYGWATTSRRRSRPLSACAAAIADNRAVDERVFVSYRRDDTAHVAGRLYDRFAGRFGRRNVFMDVSSLAPGLDFPEKLAEELARCSILLALIGANWLTSADGRRRRLDDAGDWVAHEISTALARGIPVVPVLVDGAALPDAADLPQALAPLVRKQALHIDHASFESDASALLNALAPDGQSMPDKRRVFVVRADRIVDPIRLGVHPAAAIGSADGSQNRTPPFVERELFADLCAAMTCERFVLVVGDSTAGKTRLAFEAMRASLPHHVCVVPAAPQALADAVKEARASRPAVLWLDDLERFLGSDALASAGLAELLDGDGVVVVATLRAHERADYSPRYAVRVGNDQLTDLRAGQDILDRAAEFRLERIWSTREIASAAEKADDPRIAQALASADRYGLAQFMASGPQLLRDLHDAWSVAPARRSVKGAVGDPRGAALVNAAVDIRLTGYHRPVPLSLLRRLHEVYLARRGGPALRPGSWKNAVAWATQPIHATSSLLEPDADGEWSAFDYLVDAAANDPSAPSIPDETWAAVADHAALAEAVDVAWQACYAGRFAHAQAVAERALAQCQFMIAAQVAECLGVAGQERAAVALLEAAVAGAERSASVDPQDLLAMRRMLAWEVGEKRAGQGDPERALLIARRVAADAAELFGEIHPETLLARVHVARQLGATGAAEEALAVADTVSEQAAAALGPDHPVVDTARFEAAVWAEDTHGLETMTRRFGELLADMRERPDLDVLATIDIEWNLGGALLAAGDPHSAVPLLKALVDKAAEAFGPTYARTLGYRQTHLAAVAAAAADVSESKWVADLAAELVADCIQVLGPDHVITVAAQRRATLIAEDGPSPSGEASQSPEDRLPGTAP
jgi:hypothetical protein